MIFATPDFGAGAMIWGMVCLAWMVILVLVASGLAWGMNLLNNKSPKGRRNGLLLVLVSGTVPLCCCLLPPQVFYVTYGNYPLGRYPSGKIENGMTREDVEAILGTPHDRFRSDFRESWYYYLDSFGIGYFGVVFGPDGRVTGTHGD